MLTIPQDLGRPQNPLPRMLAVVVVAAVAASLPAALAVVKLWLLFAPLSPEILILVI